jgi:HlyD family secretion protein
MTALLHQITPARAVALIASVAALAACSEPPADANGRFEATEITISAETSGRMLSLTVTDGDAVTADAVIGGIDTIAVSLSQQELRARTAALTARLEEARSHGRALAGQAAIAEREVGRLTRLAAGGAATAQQLDRARTEHATLLQQVAANEALQQSVRAESGVFDAQQAQLNDRLGRATVRSPISGVVLTRYVEPGELVQPGTPLLKVAALDTLVLRAYLSEAQLQQLRIGQSVTVQVDDAGGSLRALQGQVTWIASQAEFTPTPIQTREERIAQVYAVTVRVPNGDGRLRIGMPGELMLGTATGTPE